MGREQGDKAQQSWCAKEVHVETWGRPRKGELVDRLKPSGATVEISVVLNISTKMHACDKNFR